MWSSMSWRIYSIKIMGLGFTPWLPKYCPITRGGRPYCAKIPGGTVEKSAGTWYNKKSLF